MAVEGGVRPSGPLSVTSPWKVTIALSRFSCGEEVPTVGASVNAHSRTEVNTVLDWAVESTCMDPGRLKRLHELAGVEPFHVGDVHR